MNTLVLVLVLGVLFFFVVVYALRRGMTVRAICKLPWFLLGLEAQPPTGPKKKLKP